VDGRITPPISGTTGRKVANFTRLLIYSGYMF
jgi:hypothetical protein